MRSEIISAVEEGQVIPAESSRRYQLFGAEQWTTSNQLHGALEIYQKEIERRGMAIEYNFLNPEGKREWAPE